MVVGRTAVPFGPDTLYPSCCRTPQVRSIGESESLDVRAQRLRVVVVDLLKGHCEGHPFRRVVSRGSAEVDGAYTQARGLDQVPEMVADAVPLLADVPVGEISPQRDLQLDREAV